MISQRPFPVYLYQHDHLYRLPEGVLEFAAGWAIAGGACWAGASSGISLILEGCGSLKCGGSLLRAQLQDGKHHELFAQLYLEVCHARKLKGRLLLLSMPK